MAVFKYDGVSVSGQRINGVVEAFDQFDALEKARQQCAVVDNISQVAEKPGFLKAEIGSGKVKVKALSIMCSQFSTILVAGMGMAKCVQLVADQTSDKALRPILQEVAADVAAGHTLADSFENKGGDKLPVILYETIRAGELAGTLEMSFESLEKYFTKTGNTRAKLVGALTYPIFVVILAVVVVAVMMVAVVPTFKDILSANGGEMPAMTQILIDASDFFTQYGIFMLLFIVIVVIAWKLWTKTERGREKWAEIQLKMPVLGKIRILSNAALFANTMSILLTSGLQVTSAVETTSKVLDNYIMSRDTNRMCVKLEEGRRLSDCLRDVAGMPQALIEMVAIGEESGSLEDTLNTMGEFYDQETERLTESAISKLEPGLLVFIAVFAGYIVIALYMAMFAIYGSM